MGLSKLKNKVREKLNQPSDPSSPTYTTEPPYSNNGAFSQNSLPAQGRSYPNDLHKYSTADPDTQPRRYSPTFQTPSPNPGYPEYMPRQRPQRSMQPSSRAGHGTAYPVYMSPYTYPTNNAAPAYTRQSSNPYADPFQDSEEVRGDRSEEDLTEKEKGLEHSLGVSEAEKARSDAERRRVVREYLRRNRDINQHRMM